VSEPSIAPDPIVETALRLLPVPPHGAPFWDDLDVRLRAEGASATAPRRAAPLTAAPPAHRPAPTILELRPDPALALVPPALRRRSNGVLAVAAVAAAVLVVVAGAALVRQRSADDVGTTETAGSTEDPGAISTLTSTTDTTTATAPTGEDDEVSSAAVLAWVAALAEGDLDAAWDALGPASQQQWGSKAAFEQERSGLAEGYGAWAAATPDHVVVTSLLASGDGSVVVVTLVGEVQQEGTVQHRADSFPVRVVDGSAQLEPFAFAGEVEIVIPEPVPDGGTRPVVDGDELIVVVPEGVEAPIVRLDDGPTLVCGEAPGTELTDLDQAPGQRCSFTPEGGIPAGSRVLTVAFLSPDGSAISAESVLFEAA